jgi:hypothetical protein
MDFGTMIRFFLDPDSGECHPFLSVTGAAGSDK